MSQVQLASSVVPGMRGFLREIAITAIVPFVFFSMGIFVPVLHSSLFSLIFCLPVILVGVYFAWLRNFHPDRVPAALAQDSFQMRKLKRIGQICFFTGFALLVACIAAGFAACLCNNEKLAAHLNLWLAAVGVIIYVPFAMAMSMHAYLRERNQESIPGFRWQKSVPRSELYRRPGPGEIKPFQSEHWGER